MIQHICLIVAQVANRILTIMRVLEGTNSELREAIEVQDLLEVTNLVVTDV